MLIYCITNIANNKKYIGQTKNSLSRRYSGAFWKKPSNEHLKNAVEKYGKDNFKVEIIIKCDSISALNYWEKYYINLYKCYDKKFGYNKSYGGNNFNPTPEAVEINRQAQIKYWANPEARKAQSERKKKGLCSTKEHQLKMSLVQGAKPFKVFKKDTKEYVGTWINKAECAKELNIDHRHISCCLLGRYGRKSHKGYIFEVINEPFN